MKIKICPNKPLAPLNDLFPGGIPVLAGVEASLGGNEEDAAYIFNGKGLSQDLLKKVVRIASCDRMPAILTFAFLADGELFIPKRWCHEQKIIT